MGPLVGLSYWVWVSARNRDDRLTNFIILSKSNAYIPNTSSFIINLICLRYNEILQKNQTFNFKWVKWKIDPNFFFVVSPLSSAIRLSVVCVWREVYEWLVCYYLQHGACVRLFWWISACVRLAHLNCCPDEPASMTQIYQLWARGLQI